MARIIRIGTSFAIVVVAYWVYALVAVPLIEPSAEGQQPYEPFEEQREAILQERQQRLNQLQPLFKAGAWELDNPKMLQSDQVRLLLRDYANLGEGAVEIRPCTMIFTPDEPDLDAADRNRRSVILQAPEGALLEFDEPFDLRRAKVGRLVSGKLKGRITIRSDNRLPGPQDDLLIVTRDVELTEDRIRTPHPVDFRLGSHYGTGHELEIKLLPGDEAKQSKRRGPNIAGIESFEVRRLERLHLEFGEASIMPGQPPAPGRPSTGSNLPIEISCRGPFRFDPVQQLATFEDRVDVLQLHPDGPSDQLACEVLSIYFARPRKTPAGDPGPDGSPDERPFQLNLKPRRVEARGTPVVVTAPSREIEVRGERLEYELWNGRILLEGSEEVYLRQGGNEIRAPSIRYQSAGPGRLGQAVAAGPGRLRGKMADRPGQELEARWQKQLQVRQHEQQQVISLTGGAELDFGRLGKLTAAEIHFWLLESTPAAQNDRARLQPDRMLARGNVLLNSPQLGGAVEQLEVWFEQDPSAGHQAAEAVSDRRPVPRGVEVAGHNAAYPQTVRRLMAPQAETPSQQHFEILGKLLRSRVVLRGEQSELSELMVEGNVRFSETQTARPDERPLVVSGDRIHVVGANTPGAAVTVTGSPAHFEGRGLGLTGSNINLNRGTNRLWIDGAGRMDLPLDRDLEGRPLPDAGFLQVHWERDMAFDGRTARFNGAVVAAQQHRHLRTETLEVGFQEPIRFAEAGSGSRPQPEEIRCGGGVFMENRSFDEVGQASLERMEVADLVINLTSGATSAAGPGRVATVRRGSADLLASRPGTPAIIRPDTRPQPGDDRLTYLNVRFRGSLLGNLHQRQMTFHDQVRTIYGPVDSFDATLPDDDPDALGPRGAILTCDQLGVAEMIAPSGNGRAMELEALGNTLVEGRTFTARAVRMTYAEAKDLLILEGNGRTDAELFRQEQVGGPTSKAAARKILYWPSTNRLKVDGARSLELTGFPGR